MSIQLTRKYRPQTFAEVVGQDFIKQVLSRAALENKVAHVYLFSGTRGVGKTTIARILAKTINCEKFPTAEPCNKCSNCIAITKGISPDVLEIDGASHTGVDNVRKLREDVFLPPISGNYKVIIIDEAHMLSKAAFNAFLKTLEEPPKHCVFVFATTEPERFPITIISRSQHYVFNALTQSQIESHLQNILNLEGIKYELQAISLIAKRADGSIRDSMSLLAQVLALSGNELQEEDVRKILGLAGEELFQRLFESLIQENLIELHNLVEYLREQGLDLGFFIKEFGLYWRNLFLIAQLKNEANKILGWEKDKLDYWINLSKQFGIKRIHASWQMVVEAQRTILKNVDPILDLELLFFNLAYLSKLLGVEELTIEDKRDEIENKISLEKKKNNLNLTLKKGTEKILNEKKDGQEIKEHPLVKKIIEEFDARILAVVKS
ncbi:DNA polymerase III subunit gamma/tau [Desulfonauticus submarinus]